MILSEFLSFIIMSPTQWVKKSVYRKSFTLNHILPKYGSCCTRSVCLHCLVMLEDPEMALFFFVFFCMPALKMECCNVPTANPRQPVPKITCKHGNVTVTPSCNIMILFLKPEIGKLQGLQFVEEEMWTHKNRMQQPCKYLHDHLFTSSSNLHLTDNSEARLWPNTHCTCSYTFRILTVQT